MIKKLTAAFLALTLVLSFAACSKNNNDNKTSDSNPTVAAAPEDAVKNLEDILNQKYDGKEAALMPKSELDEVTNGNVHYYDALVEEIEKSAVNSLLDLREEYKNDLVTAINIDKIETEPDSDKASVSASITITDGESTVWEKKDAQFSLRKVDGNWYIDYHTF